MEIQVNSKTSSVYSKEVSVMMAGCAIVMMMTLHLFQDSVAGGWLSDGVGWHSVLGQFAEYAMRWIRVSGAVVMFALTSGYVLYANPKAYATMKSRALRLLRFLLVYWTIECLFLGVGFLNGDTMPTASQFLWNLIGRQTSPFEDGVNIPFAWYVTYYIEFILLVPVLLWAYKGRNIIRDTVVTIGIGIGVTLITLPLSDGPVRSVLSCLYPLRSTCLGILIAKYALFDKIHQWIGCKLPLWSLFVSFIAVGICIHILEIINPLGGVRWASFESYLTFILKAIRMVVVLEMLLRIRSNRFKQVLCVLAKYSLYLWLLHGIFFTGKHFLQVELYSLQEPILILVVCIVALLPIAYVIDKFVSLIFGVITQRMGKS